MEDEEDKVITLKVIKSPIHGEGIARMHEKHLKEVEIEEGELGVVYVDETEDEDEKAILVKIFTDNMMQEGVIRLRKDDRKSLGVKEGDIVKVTEFHSASERIKELLGDVKEKIEDLKDKVVGFFKHDKEKEKEKED